MKNECRSRICIQFIWWIGVESKDARNNVIRSDIEIGINIDNAIDSDYIRTGIDCVSEIVQYFLSFEHKISA